MPTKQLLVVMGPSGCGKSTVAEGLAKALGTSFIEGDDCHSKANKSKMAAGVPLTDQDRVDWVETMLARVSADTASRVILASSALTPFVQKRLSEGSAHTTHFFLLDAPREVLEQRLKARSDHFMPVELLDSQLEALDPPKGVVKLDAQMNVEQIVAGILQTLDEQSER